MIEAWWRSLKHQWLFLHSLDSAATIRRLVAFYVHEHDHVLPHSAFRGQTPDEMYFGTGAAVPAELASRAAAACRARIKGNRTAAPTSEASLTEELAGGSIPVWPTNFSNLCKRLPSCSLGGSVARNTTSAKPLKSDGLPFSTKPGSNR